MTIRPISEMERTEGDLYVDTIFQQLRASEEFCREVNHHIPNYGRTFSVAEQDFNQKGESWSATKVREVPSNYQSPDATDLCVVKCVNHSALYPIPTALRVKIGNDVNEICLPLYRVFPTKGKPFSVASQRSWERSILLMFMYSTYVGELYDRLDKKNRQDRKILKRFRPDIERILLCALQMSMTVPKDVMDTWREQGKGFFLALGEERVGLKTCIDKF